MATIPLTISGIKEAQAQLKALGDEFDRIKDTDDVTELSKQYNQLAKDVHKAEKAFDDLNESGEYLTATFEDIYGEGLKPMTTQIGELEDRLYAMRDAGQQNSEEFKVLTGEVARLRTNIIETDRQIDLLAENKGFSVFGTGITQVGESLLRLDFEGASRDAKALNNAVGNLGTMGAKALKGLGSTVGQLSKAFLKMGASLLLNPVFLLATAITAIVVAIGALLNELGFLQPILDAIGAVFGWIKDAIMSVVQALKDFTDWLGITNHAGKEMAREQVNDMQKIIDKSAEVQETISTRYDQEIRLANIAGEDTSQMEVKKQESILKTLQIRKTALEQQLEALKISGDADEEQIQKIQDQIKETDKLAKQALFEITAINAQADADADKRRDEQLKKDQEAYKKRLDALKAFNNQILQLERQLEDVRAKREEDDLQREIDANATKYARLIEDIDKNESLTEAQKTEIKNKYLELEFENRKDIELKYQNLLEDAIDANAKKREADRLEARKKAQEAQLEAQKAYSEAVKTQLEKDEAEQKAYNEARLGLGNDLVTGLSGIEQLIASSGRETAGLQKTIALVQIATDTAKAISSVVAGATAAAAAGGPAAPFLIAGYIASGIGTIASAIASAKTALDSAPSLGGGGGGTVAGVGQVSTAQPAQPSFDLFGQNNNANNLSAPQDVEANQTIEVKAVVSETEVTETQNTVQKIIQNSSL